MCMGWQMKVDGEAELSPCSAPHEQVIAGIAKRIKKDHEIVNIAA
jgi:hypothetical protein